MTNKGFLPTLQPFLKHSHNIDFILQFSLYPKYLFTTILFRADMYEENLTRIIFLHLMWEVVALPEKLCSVRNSIYLKWCMFCAPCCRLYCLTVNNIHHRAYMECISMWKWATFWYALLNDTSVMTVLIFHNRSLISMHLFSKKSYAFDVEHDHPLLYPKSKLMFC